MDKTLMNVVAALLTATISGAVGYFLHDFGRRLSRLEAKTTALVMAVFWLILKDPQIPPETRRALEKAMAM